MAKKIAVRLTANFQRNLEEIERFLCEADAGHAYAGLLDELLDTVIPNLEQFPQMGRPFLDREFNSVEAATAGKALKKRLADLTTDSSSLREYVMENYLVLYATIRDTVYLLSIKHHRQLSFDFDAQWKPKG